MQVLLNGEPRALEEGLTVAALVEALGFAAGTVVVERNGEVVLHSETGTTNLADGDRLELVRAVAGG